MPKKTRKCPVAGCENSLGRKCVVCIFHYHTLDIQTRVRVLDLVRIGAYGDAKELATRMQVTA
jgi:hypothetical protein